MVTRLVVKLILVFGAFLITAPVKAQAPVLKGRLVNGTQMLKTGGMGTLDEAGSGFKATAPRLPIIDKNFELRITEGVQVGKKWAGKTDENGNFELTLNGLSQIPAGKVFVASVESSIPLHTLNVQISSEGDTEFILYELSDDSKFLPQTGMETLYLLRGGPGEDKELEVHVNLMVQNYAGTMYVGKPLRTISGKTVRAVARVPLPEKAKIIKNEAFYVHDRSQAPSWTITKDGWAILDSPQAPYTEANRGVFYMLTYRVPAYQEQAFAYPVDLPLEQFTAWCIHQDMEIASPALKSSQTRKRLDPMLAEEEQATAKPLTWNLMGQSNLKENAPLGLVLTVDSMVLRQINSGALKVVLSLVLGSLFAVLIGLVLGSRAPRVEAVLKEASGEEIIQRIAQLDAQFEKGQIAKNQYQEKRKTLLSLARYEVSELRETKAQAQTPSEAKPSSEMPEKVKEISKRLEELEKEGSTDPAKVQERLLLLEDLAKAIRNSEKATS